MYKQLLLATNNKGKLREYRAILAPLGITVVGLTDLNLDLDPEETGNDYQENALIKAKALSRLTNYPVIADDSGLEISALNGFPGLHSARFAKEEHGNDYLKAGTDLISRLDGQDDRSARFVCVICLLEPGKKPLFFEGECPGYILTAPIGTNGFGYDPIFHSIEGDVDFGTADDETKNLYSHRAKALLKLATYLAI